MINKKSAVRKDAGNSRLGSGTCVSAIIIAVLLFITVSFSSCGGDKITVLDESIHGFYLGEAKGGIFVKSRVSWKLLDDPRTGSRGEIYEFSGVLSERKDVDRAHLTFLDDRLMEIIVYYRQNNVSKLKFLKKMMEKRYGGKCTYPDGTIEMAYKTYWLKGPGMSITIRRITKKPETELYVQYLHNELHEKLKKRRKGS